MATITRHSRMPAIIALLAALVMSLSASAAVPVNSSTLRDAVNAAEIYEHLEAFQAIADANGGTRAAGTSGYNASVDYVAGLLDAAGYEVTIQEFDFAYYEQVSPSQMIRTDTDPDIVYTYGEDFFTMTYSGSGDVTATVQAVDLLLPPTGGSTSGCEPEDFAGFVPGNIALVQRGTCFFSDKAENALAAGAVGVIIFNEGNAPDRTEAGQFDLVNPIDIPVLFTSFDIGVTLDGATVRMVTDTISEIRPTYNVIAETPAGRDDRVVMVGAHLDSVTAGPGINDNGSGSATILEIALEMAELGIQPRNTVRFAFWGAEESGLLGSQFYVDQLTKREIKNIAVNLNFDMVGSPNYVRFVYDGDGSGTGTAGPNGSAVVEGVFLDYFAAQGLATEPTAFDGRSDYGPFIAVGIPAGGLFTGAEGIKTAEEAAIYGGTAGIAYDPCYHQACDTLANVNLEVLEQMADAAAHATLTFAMTTSAVNGTDKGNAIGHPADAEFRGHRHVR